MGTYDWMEVQTLTAEIETSRSRLAAAKKTRDVGKIGALEDEIAAAEARRERLLVHITTNLVTAPDPPPPRKAGNGRAPAVAEPAPPPAPEATAEAAFSAEPAPQPEVVAEATASAEPPAQPEAAASAEPAPEPAVAADVVSPAEPPPAAVAESADTPPDAVAEDRAVASDAASPASAPKAPEADRRTGGSAVWDQLKPGDIERARRDLETRRAEMLARHEEELKGLEADRAELDTLEQAIAVFLQRFNAPPAKDGVVQLEDQHGARQQGAG
jgi:hypothetical protein